jgi:hypothetical protein
LIQRYTTRGALVTQWRVRDGRGASLFVGALATDRAGHVYAVASTGMGALGPDRLSRGTIVLEYTANGRLMNRWNLRSAVSDLAVSEAGDVYVTATDENRIEKYSSTGRFLLQFEAPWPRAVVTDASGNLYVVDWRGVSVYRDNGAFLRSWPTSARPVGPAPETGGPEFRTDVAVDHAGRILVAEAGIPEHWVKVYTPEGEYADQIGGPGRGSGRFRYPPNFLAIDGRGDIYAVTVKTVQKFGEPSSAFSLGGVKLNRRNGTARLTANVPGVGKLNVKGTGIRPSRRRASMAGDVTLAIIPSPAAKRKLQRTGRATVTIKVTYTPTTAGDAHPATRSTRLSLVKLR